MNRSAFLATAAQQLLEDAAVSRPGRDSRFPLEGKIARKTGRDSPSRDIGVAHLAKAAKRKQRA